MASTRRFIAYLVIALLAASFGASFLVRPKGSLPEIITGKELLPDPRKEYPVDTGLAERISKSYGIPMVLIISEFSKDNALALQSLRMWARDQYYKDPTFLHTLLTQPTADIPSNVVSAVGTGLLSLPRNWLEDLVLKQITNRVREFHTTKVFERLRTDYFDVFGLDQEAALLLARYESERLHNAVGVVMTASLWAAALVIITFIVLIRIPPESRVQRWLSHFWLAVALFYWYSASVLNQVALLIAGFAAFLAALYLWRPSTGAYGEDKRFRVRAVSLEHKHIAFACWITFTLVAIQIVTWIRTGSLLNPDPITLLISSFAGDFIHDPHQAKRWLLRIVGFGWIAFGLWTLWSWQRQTDKDVEKAFDLLSEPVSKESR